ncbi:uncharacterized protein LOC119315949 [Triticum dicoccoides]|uniref:uncharacterized protein LOC119315949 n=1 Tax=Triticum dicoccoides TaxID=85692 RepID=UPI001890CCC7|nr:uncharacterized protein LOC119315949 [Triticum dicoccoides]
MEPEARAHPAPSRPISGDRIHLPPPGIGSPRPRAASGGGPAVCRCRKCQHRHHSSSWKPLPCFACSSEAERAGGHASRCRAPSTAWSSNLRRSSAVPALLPPREIRQISKARAARRRSVIPVPAEPAADFCFLFIEQERSSLIPVLPLFERRRTRSNARVDCATSASGPRPSSRPSDWPASAPRPGPWAEGITVLQENPCTSYI